MISPKDIRVKIVPNARKEFVAIERDGRLLISVHAPRKEGRANDRLRELVALHFAVPVKQVRIISGHQSSSKTLRIS